jgi:plastocyanin
MVRAMRRTLLPLAAALALGLSAAACGGSDDGASGCTPADADLAVGAKDSLKFDQESYETDAGCIEVTYTNEGSTSHNLLIDGKSGFKLSIGDVDTGTVELPAGNYELYCDVSGHRATMHADLTVR